MPASGFCVPVPVTSGCTGAGTGGKFDIFKKCLSDINTLKSHSIPLLHQTISHTFCPECFVLCPACIFTVLSAWKLRNVHGVQKASV
ncbi:unnamed protein product [Staurois parvus]|uniref:Uncharacterized protein n=1 Tax=Staurois parvus TaxID=386267 RepID=A0ABN9CI04_9NEOB|nr:unnamed protein product [Staurois parvus]